MGDFGLSWNRNPPPPSPVSFPSITGIPRDGETLTASEGSWTGGEPITFAFTWFRCDRDFDNCNIRPNEGLRTYALRGADVGFRFYVIVTASNPSGSASEFSNVTPPVAALPPTNADLPSISGNARPGGLVVATTGAWTGTLPMSMAYQWQSCNANGDACTDIAGQMGQVMRVANLRAGARHPCRRDGDERRRLRVC